MGVMRVEVEQGFDVYCNLGTSGSNLGYTGCPVVMAAVAAVVVVAEVGSVWPLRFGGGGDGGGGSDGGSGGGSGGTCNG